MEERGNEEGSQASLHLLGFRDQHLTPIAPKLTHVVDVDWSENWSRLRQCRRLRAISFTVPVQHAQIERLFFNAEIADFQQYVQGETCVLGPRETAISAGPLIMPIGTYSGSADTFTPVPNHIFTANLAAFATTFNVFCSTRVMNQFLD